MVEVTNERLEFYEMGLPDHPEVLTTLEGCWWLRMIKARATTNGFGRIAKKLVVYVSHATGRFVLAYRMENPRSSIPVMITVCVLPDHPDYGRHVRVGAVLRALRPSKIAKAEISVSLKVDKKKMFDSRSESQARAADMAKVRRKLYGDDDGLAEGLDRMLPYVGEQEAKGLQSA